MNKDLIDILFAILCGIVGVSIALVAAILHAISSMLLSLMSIALAKQRKEEGTIELPYGSMTPYEHIMSVWDIVKPSLPFRGLVKKVKDSSLFSYFRKDKSTDDNSCSLMNKKDLDKESLAADNQRDLIASDADDSPEIDSEVIGDSKPDSKVVPPVVTSEVIGMENVHLLPPNKDD